MRPANAGRAQPDPTCPSCGRPTIDPGTGSCRRCHEPAERLGRTTETARIVRLADFERSRAKLRTARKNRWIRKLVAVVLGILAALAILCLFGVMLRGAEGLFARRIPGA